MRAARWLLGAVGALSMAAGARMLLGQPAPTGVVRWLAGAVVLHDVVLAPLVLAVGLLVRRLRGHGVRGVVRGGLMVAGCVTLAALPPLLRPGQPANPTVLPLDYGRNVLLLVTVTGVVTLVLAALARSRRQRASCRVLRSD
ncbi:hypothetical protein [Streptomyces sp. NPDC127098]|uniref:hypothetical protein n=1 Tax=Streptomyces sp. NPDC127098 TaxID=3347137 RepID=UPI003649435B